MPKVSVTVFTRCKNCGIDLRVPFEREYVPNESTWSSGPNAIHPQAVQPTLAFPIHVLEYGECDATDKKCSATRREAITIAAACVLCGAEVTHKTLAKIQASGGVVMCEPDCETARKERQAAAEWGALVDTLQTVKALLFTARGLGRSTVAPEVYAEQQLILGGKSPELARNMVELAKAELQNAS